MSAIEFHPLANLFPLIEGEEFDKLVADIKANGLIEQIWLYEGKVLDGRNRYRACMEIGRDPSRWTREFRPSAYGDPLAFVLSKNLHRRHLTTQQRAAIAAELATLERGGDRRSDDFKVSNDPLKPALTVVEAATAMKVSPATVKRAKARKAADPEAHEQAKAGTLPKPPRQPRQKSAEKQPVPVAVEPGAVQPEIVRQPPARLLLDRNQWEARFREVVRALARLALAADRDEHEHHKELVARDQGLRSDVMAAAVLLHSALDRRDAKAVVAPAPKRHEPEPAAPQPAPPTVAPVAPANVEGLRAWAKTIDIDDLAKHVEAAGLKEPKWKLEGFVAGTRLGNYHLHRALETVRDDLADHGVAP